MACARSGASSLTCTSMSTTSAGWQGNKNQLLGEKTMVTGSRLKTFGFHLLFAAACSLIVLQTAL
jgi:hypothetical protein